MMPITVEIDPAASTPDLRVEVVKDGGKEIGRNYVDVRSETQEGRRRDARGVLSKQLDSGQANPSAKEFADAVAMLLMEG
jgi:hypothetical protein